VLTRAARDYYAVLGVRRDADRVAIKKAFRTLAATYHPDVCGDPNASERFKEIVEAYEVLSNPDSRARYDRRGFSRRPSHAARRHRASAPAADRLDDLFDLVKPRPGEPGRDIVVEVELAADEARHGAFRGVRYAAVGDCVECDGSGGRPGSRSSTCLACGGSGRAREVVESADGRRLRLHACARCRGLGRIVEDPCPLCAGRGRLDEERALLIRFPSGATDGSELRLTGQGSAGGEGGEAGDVVVRVRVRPGERHGILRRLAARR